MIEWIYSWTLTTYSFCEIKTNNQKINLAKIIFSQDIEIDNVHNSIETKDCNLHIYVRLFEVIVFTSSTKFAKWIVVRYRLSAQ